MQVGVQAPHHAAALPAAAAQVVVNDLGGAVDGSGASKKAADVVVSEIKALGGQAVPSYDSCTDGEAIVATALQAFGRLDILVNNAGILRDGSFQKMTDAAWESVLAVHLQGTFSVTRAAWPHMREAGYGRIINVASSTGLYGNFGQANYGAAKMGILGLSSTLALEGARRGIRVNTISPIAASRMTADVMPPDLLAALAPEAVAPLVAFLAHESCACTGRVFEAGAGWVAQVRWQRSAGAALPPRHSLEDIAAAWPAVVDFDDGKATHPSSTQSAFEPIMANVSKHAASGDGVGQDIAGAADAAGASGKRPTSDPDLALPVLEGGRTGHSDAVDVQKVLTTALPPTRARHDARDAMLYALSVGASRDPADAADLAWTYELAPGFAVLPTFAVLWPHAGNAGIVDMPGLAFNPMMLLHGEQETVWGDAPLPTSGDVTTTTRVGAVYDKGSGAVVVLDSTSREAGSPAVLALNRSRIFIRGIGGFGGDRGPPAPAWQLPSGPPALSVSVTLPPNAALLYRLNGDRNPLHADPDMAAMGGFSAPILHGLCSYGVAGYLVVKHLLGGDAGALKRMSARFAKHVFPGETLTLTAWWGQGAPVDDRATRQVLFKLTLPGRGDAEVLTRGVAEVAIDVANAQGVQQTQQGAEPALACTRLFTSMADALRGEGGQKLVQQVRGKIAFLVSTPAQASHPVTWVVDLTASPGSVRRLEGGTSPPSDVHLSVAVADGDLCAIADGALNAQQAFLRGKLKLKGNMALAAKLGAVLAAATQATPAKL